MQVEIVPIENLIPSTYNPRVSDSHRLELLSLSLRKLGWLLPVYATPDGEIISGHQRHLVASRLGATHVPVVWTKRGELEKRKAVNIMFNRATNDLSRGDSCEGMRSDLSRADAIIASAESMPDKPLDWFPCAEYRLIPIKPILEANRGMWVNYARNLAGSMASNGLWMPVVVDPDGQIVNGVGRVQYAAERGRNAIEVVSVSHAEAELAKVLLNKLSMDFNVHERYADTLRHNSFRRAYGTKGAIGVAFVVDAFNVMPNKVDLRLTATQRRWVSHYGRVALDFGAGLLQDVQRLRSFGVHCSAFEPYRLTPGTQSLDLSLSRAGIRDFLAEVRSGVRWNSIFQNSVMNSIPFIDDRRKVVRIIGSLAGPQTAVHATAISVDSKRGRLGRGYDALNGSDAKTSTFPLDYEPNITLGDFSSLPKVQKFHTEKEWFDLWSEAFSDVKVRTTQQLVCCVCRNPKPVDRELLIQAINHEFDLPFPGDRRLGLTEEAKSAFLTRLYQTI